MHLFWMIALLCQEKPPLVQEELKVQFRQIQIRVQDNDFVPQKGLTKKDFTLLVNDKLYDPENFEEIDYYPDEQTNNPAESQARPAETPSPELAATESSAAKPGQISEIEQTPRAVAIVLDPGISTVKGFSVMKEAAKDLVKQLPAGTKITVYQMHHSLRNLMMLSTDRVALNQAIDSAVYFPDLWNKMEPLQRGINQLVAELSSKGGLSLAKEGIENTEIPKINELGDLLKFKKQVKDVYLSKFAAGLSSVGSSLINVPGERSIYLLTSGGYMDDSNRSLIRTVTAKLNWENIPLHTMHFRDRDNKDLSGIVGSRLSETDLQDMHQILVLGGFIQENSSVNALNEEESHLKTAPRTFADETGGTFISAFNPLQVEKQLGRMRLASGHFYLITYRTQSELDKIDVKLSQPNKAWTVSFGNTRGKYSVPLTGSKKEAKMGFATELMYGLEHENIPIDWAFESFRNEDGVYVFPVMGRLSGTFPKKGYKLGLVAVSEAGLILDERTAEIRKPGPDGELQFYDLLACKEHPTTIRAMIQDIDSGESNLAEYRVSDASDGPNLSSIILVPSKAGAVFAIHSLNKEEVKLKMDEGKPKKMLRDKVDPLVKGPNQRVPLAIGPFPAGQPIGLYFHAQQLTGAINQYELESFLQVGDQKQPAPIKVNKVEALNNTQTALMAVLDVSRLPANEYTVGIRLKDKRSGMTTAYSEQMFKIQ